MHLAKMAALPNFLKGNVLRSIIGFKCPGSSVFSENGSIAKLAKCCL
jgi:hypothetical protein